jgi:hypothetical protein
MSYFIRKFTSYFPLIINRSGEFINQMFCRTQKDKTPYILLK